MTPTEEKAFQTAWENGHQTVDWDDCIHMEDVACKEDAHAMCEAVIASQGPKPEREPFKDIVKRLAFLAPNPPFCYQPKNETEQALYKIIDDAINLMNRPTLCEWCGKDADHAEGEDGEEESPINAHNVHDKCYEAILNGSGIS